MSRAEHEALVEAAGKAILAEVPFGYGMTKPEAEKYARAVLALIAQKLETVTEEMARPVSEAIMNAWQEGSSDRICAADTYLMMLRASPLFPGKDP